MSAQVRPDSRSDSAAPPVSRVERKRRGYLRSRQGRIGPVRDREPVRVGQRKHDALPNFAVYQRLGPNAPRLVAKRLVPLVVRHEAMQAEVLRNRQAGVQQRRNQGSRTGVAAGKDKDGNRLQACEIVILQEIVPIQARNRTEEPARVSVSLRRPGLASGSLGAHHRLAHALISPSVRPIWSCCAGVTSFALTARSAK